MDGGPISSASRRRAGFAALAVAALGRRVLGAIAGLALFGPLFGGLAALVGALVFGILGGVLVNVVERVAFFAVGAALGWAAGLAAGALIGWPVPVALIAALAAGALAVWLERPVVAIATALLGAWATVQGAAALAWGTSATLDAPLPDLGHPAVAPVVWLALGLVYTVAQLGSRPDPDVELEPDAA